MRGRGWRPGGLDRDATDSELRGSSLGFWPPEASLLPLPAVGSCSIV